MIKRILLIFVVFLALLAFYGLGLNNRLYSSEELYLRVENSDDFDEIKKYLNEIARREKEGIPIFNRLLTKEANTIYNSDSYVMIGIILSRLNDLAEKNIYIPEEVPVLIDVINKQIANK